MDIIKGLEGIDLDNFMNIKAHRILDLLKDENDLTEDESVSISKIKDALIEEEIMDLNAENVLPDVEMIMSNIPDNVSTLEKIRFIYINLGKLFSYDYRVVNDMKYGIEKKVDYDRYLSRYQTCIQISEILNKCLNKIPGVSSKTIERTLENQRNLFGESHVANEVILDDNGYELKILLDLTLDLYLIQSNCLTKHFGFESDAYATYDIIPQMDSIKMDQSLGLMHNTEYTDYRVEELSRVLNEETKNLNPKEKLNQRLISISTLNRTFKGYHEGKQYVNMLFDKMLKAYYKEYNIYYRKENEINLKTIYKIELDDEEKWIIYSNNTGFLSTTKEKIKDMLNNGWETNSNSLLDDIYSIESKRML